LAMEPEQLAGEQCLTLNVPFTSTRPYPEAGHDARLAPTAISALWRCCGSSGWPPETCPNGRYVALASWCALWIAGLAQPDRQAIRSLTQPPSRAESRRTCVFASALCRRQLPGALADRLGSGGEAQLACPLGQGAGADGREPGNEAFSDLTVPAGRPPHPPASGGQKRETRFSGAAGRSGENIAARSRQTGAAPATTAGARVSSRLPFQQVIFCPWRPANPGPLGC
jgi:hypothetical protein